MTIAKNVYRANRRHQCDQCKRSIVRGQRYTSLFGYAHSGDKPYRIKLCEECYALPAGSMPLSETKPSEPQAKEESSTIQILPPTYPYDTRPSDWIIPIEPQASQSVPIQESDGEK